MVRGRAIRSMLVPGTEEDFRGSIRTGRDWVAGGAAGRNFTGWIGRRASPLARGPSAAQERVGLVFRGGRSLRHCCDSTPARETLDYRGLGSGSSGLPGAVEATGPSRTQVLRPFLARRGGRSPGAQSLRSRLLSARGLANLQLVFLHLWVIGGSDARRRGDARPPRVGQASRVGK